VNDALAVLGAGRVERPARGRGPGVLVLAGAGTSRGALVEGCRRLADHGFVAWAPAAEGAGDAPADGEAVERLFRLDAVEGSRVGVVGLGGGGALALAAASQRVAVALCLEPGDGVEGFEPGGSPDAQRLEARVLLVCAEKDPAAEEGLPGLREALHAAGARVELRVVPGVEAGFLDPLRADRYDARAARLAWDAALAVLRAEL